MSDRQNRLLGDNLVFEDKVVFYVFPIFFITINQHFGSWQNLIQSKCSNVILMEMDSVDLDLDVFKCIYTGGPKITSRVYLK